MTAKHSHNETDPSLLVGRELDEQDVAAGVLAGLRNLDTLLQRTELLFFQGKPAAISGRTGLIPKTYVQTRTAEGIDVVVMPEQARKAQEMVLRQLREHLQPEQPPETSLPTAGAVKEYTTRWSAIYKQHKFFFYEVRIESAPPDSTGLEVIIANYEPADMTSRFNLTPQQQRRDETTVQAEGSIPAAILLSGINQQWEAERAPKPPALDA